MHFRPPALSCVASVSGIRGVIGDSLTPDQVLYLAAAFGSAIAGRGPVVLGRDSRPTGEMLMHAAAAGLRGVGCEVIEIGIVPTPTVALEVLHHRAAGGIQVSASHNGVEWNALKLINDQGRTCTADQLEWTINTYNDIPVGMWRRWDGCGRMRRDEGAVERHIERVLAAVDARLIRSAAIPVAVDCVNGAGAVMAPELLRRLGCKVTVIDGRPDQPFPRNPEPTVANAAATAAMTAASGAQVGFIQDPDADRLALVDGRGRYIGEEYTLAVCADARLAQHTGGGVAVTNLSTSRMLDDVAARHGARVVRTRVGEANVLDGMARHGAVIAGEGNGGVIDPRVVHGRDSHIGMALVLERMAASGSDLAGLVAAIPAYAMRKARVALDRSDVAAAIERVAAGAVAQGAAVDRQDGLKLSWGDRWVNLRASGTEPVARIIAEAPDEAAAAALVAAVAETAQAELLEAH
ncbi:MAG: Phosphoglucosamine mutase [Planctomycetota bacterium]|jgi:phosphomannomutase